MFHLFGGTADDTPRPITLPKSCIPEKGYTVGRSSEGQTLLKVMCNHNTITLTMNDNATRLLIRLLEATLDDTEDSDE